ncbi:MAG: hypothetical protein ACI9EW_003006 [Cellvibrionaceae bacterium]|jgi:hypothetical protein
MLKGVRALIDLRELTLEGERVAGERLSETLLAERLTHPCPISLGPA